MTFLLHVQDPGRAGGGISLGVSLGTGHWNEPSPSTSHTSSFGVGISLHNMVSKRDSALKFIHTILPVCSTAR